MEVWKFVLLSKLEKYHYLDIDFIEYNLSFFVSIFDIKEYNQFMNKIDSKKKQR